MTTISELAIQQFDSPGRLAWSRDCESGTAGPGSDLRNQVRMDDSAAAGSVSRIRGKGVGQIGERRDAVIPLLMEELANATLTEQVAAAQALGGFGQRDSVASPTVEDVLGDSKATTVTLHCTGITPGPDVGSGQ